MNGWIIFLIIITLIIFLIFMPIYVNIIYEDEFIVKIKYLFFSFSLNKLIKKSTTSKPEKEIQKDKTEQPRETKKNKFRAIFEKNGVSGLIDVLKYIKDTACEPVLFFIHHIFISKFNLSIFIASDDAAKTAVLYGTSCAIVYPACSIILKNSKINYLVEVIPDFNKKNSYANTDINFGISVIIILVTFFKTISRYLKIKKFLDLNSNKKESGV